MASRKRGGQTGNTNALKHGYYSPRFHELELDDLELLSEEGIANEIILLRVLIRRMFDRIDTHPLSDRDLIGAFKAVTKATVSMATLLRTQNLLDTSQSDEIAKALNQALIEVTRELGHS